MTTLEAFSKFLEDNPLIPLGLEHLKQNCGVDDDGNPCMGLPTGLTTVSCSSPEKILGPDADGLCYASADSGCGVEESTGWCEDLSTGLGVDLSEEFCVAPIYKWHPPQCQPLPQLLFTNVFLKFLRLNIQIVIWLGINLTAALWQLLDQTLEVVYVNGLIGKAPANLPVALGLTESLCALLQPKKMVILLLLNF